MKAFSFAIAMCLVGAGCSSSSPTQGPQGGPAQAGPGDVDLSHGDADPGGDSIAAVSDHPWLRGVYPADLPEETFVIGVAQHDDPEEAEARAQIVLANAAWGPVEVRPAVLLPKVFIAGEDPKRQETLKDGRTVALIAVGRVTFASRVENWLDDVAAGSLRARVADEPKARIEVAMAAARSRLAEEFGCNRLQVITGRRCDPGGVHSDNPLTIAATFVTLQPVLPGGIPRLKGERPLRPAAVEVLWKRQSGEAVPWPDVPLLFEAPDGILKANTATTDEKGYAAVDFVGMPPDSLLIKVRIDTKALLDNLSPAWPEVSTTLTLHLLTATNARIAVFLFEHISLGRIDDSPTAEAAVHGLRALGYKNALVLPQTLRDTLESARSGAFNSAVRGLADKGGGEADVIALGEVQSDFVSRAVGRSVWHEATVAVKIYDVWTGKHLGDIQRTTRARGIGDQDAAHNAMRELGDNLAEALHQTLSTGNLALSSRPW